MIDLSGKTQLNRSVNELLGPGKTMAPPVPLTQRRWRIDTLALVVWLGALYLLTNRSGFSSDTISLLQIPMIVLPVAVPYLTMRRSALVRTVNGLVLFECQGLMGEAVGIIKPVADTDVRTVPARTLKPNLEIEDARYLADRKLLRLIGIET